MSIFNWFKKTDWVATPDVDPTWIIIAQAGDVVRERKAISHIDLVSGKSEWRWERRHYIRYSCFVEQVRRLTTEEMRYTTARWFPERYGLKV